MTSMCLPDGGYELISYLILGWTGALSSAGSARDSDAPRGQLIRHLGRVALHFAKGTRNSLLLPHSVSNSGSECMHTDDVKP